MKKIILSIILSVFISVSYGQDITYQNDTPLTLYVIQSENLSTPFCMGPGQLSEAIQLVPPMSTRTFSITAGTGANYFSKAFIMESGNPSLGVAIYNPQNDLFPCVTIPSNNPSSSMCPFSFPCFASWTNTGGNGNNVTVIIR